MTAAAEQTPLQATPVAATPTPVARRLAPRAGSLQAAVDGVVGRHQGSIGVVIKHLETGETATINPDLTFRAASLYKLFVLVQAYTQMESGTLRGSETVAVSQAAFDEAPYPEWAVGTQTTSSCAIEAMITQSNNVATETLMERLGGEAQISQQMQALGLKDSVLTKTRVTTTPSDIARLVELISERKAVSPQASDAMLQLLLAQQRNDRLPYLLPASVPVAHKTGELPKLRNDAGIVFAPSGPYLFVALVDRAASDSAARDAIVDLSRAAYAYFEAEEPPAYYGLPPRLAAEVFQVPDEQGRMTPLADPWGANLDVEAQGVALAKSAKDVTVLRPVVPDLLALQRAAAQAGTPFWVTDGYEEPGGVHLTKIRPAPTSDTCREVMPPDQLSVRWPRTPAVERATVPPTAFQQWLGTVVRVSDIHSGPAAAQGSGDSSAGKWLREHAWEYGFIPALPESAAGRVLGYEPWKLRWVGREMAAFIHARTPSSEPGVVLDVLKQAVANLAAVSKKD